MKVTKRQLKNIIKEELEAALNEAPVDPAGMDVEQAKQIVSIALGGLKDGAPVRQREPQGFIYAGVASVDPRTYTVGVRVSKRATYVSHKGGSSGNYRDEQKEIDPKSATSQMFQHMGLARDLKERGMQIGGYNDQAQFKFRFAGSMDRNNEFGGYAIKPA